MIYQSPEAASNAFNYALAAYTAIVRGVENGEWFDDDMMMASSRRLCRQIIDCMPAHTKIMTNAENRLNATDMRVEHARDEKRRAKLATAEQRLT